MSVARFRRVAILGVGLIGGSIGLALRRRGVYVTGFDRAAVLRRARSRGAIDAGSTTLSGALQRADLVVVALPADRIPGLLPRIGRLAPRAAVLTDVAGAKTDVCRAARRAGLGRRFVGGHPMAGSERSGIEAARADLFRGAPWILCADRAGRPLRMVRALAIRTGARPIRLDPAAHDRTIARLSHLPQIAAVALTLTAARAGVRRGAAGPAFRQMTRLAESPPSLWRGVLAANRRETTRAIDDFLREVRRMRDLLGGGITSRFRRAARARARLLAGGPGGVRPPAR